MHMSEVDLPDRLQRYGALGFHFERIALTNIDCLDLPSFSAKEADPRHDWYVGNYGDEAWELDAMDPNDLRERVREEIGFYVDAGAWEQHKRVEAAERETVTRIATKMAEVIA